MTDYKNCANKIKEVTDYNYEKLQNKKNDISGDYSQDTDSYATVKALKEGFIEKSNTSGLVKNDGTIDTTNYSTFSGDYDDLTDKPTIPTGSSTATDIKMNGTQSAGSSSNFAKADHVHPSDTSKQDTLVSGTNIKTINSQSLLGSGNITITGSEDGTFSDLATKINTALTQQGKAVINLTKNYINTDSYSSDGIEITSGKLIIDGNGHIIDADFESRIFKLVKNSSYVELNIIFRNVIFANGLFTTGNGGAIYCDGATLTLDNCLFYFNRATYGGALSLTDTDLTVRDSYFSINGATDAGAIYRTDTGNLTITNSVFDGNYYMESSGSGDGTIYLTERTNVSISDSVFKNNDMGGYDNIYVNSGSDLVVYNCTINNVATTCYKVVNKPYLSGDDIVNDLTTGGTTKVLSAEQGKALNDTLGDVSSVISAVIAYINQ